MDERRVLDLLGGLPLTWDVGWRQPLRPYAAMHAHRGVEMVLHVAGRGLTRTARGDSEPFAPGTLVLYAPGLVHDQVAYGAGEEWCIQATPRGVVARGLTGCRAVAVGDDAYVRHEFAALTRVGSAPPAALGLRATALVAHVLALADAPAEASGGDAVEAAELVLRQRFGELKRLGEVARAVGLSLDRLRHVFRARTGVSLTARLTDLRLARARELLAHSTMRLDDVARDCGFGDGRHLARAFRRREGVSPGAWRERARKPGRG